MIEENKILVIYVGVQGIRSEDIETYTQKVVIKIMPQIFQGEIIVIPVQSLNTKIECINPKYITDEELIINHTKLMVRLEKELEHQLNELKKQNYE